MEGWDDFFVQISKLEQDNILTEIERKNPSMKHIFFEHCSGIFREAKVARNTNHRPKKVIKDDSRWNPPSRLKTSDHYMGFPQSWGYPNS